MLVSLFKDAVIVLKCSTLAHARRYLECARLKRRQTSSHQAAACQIFLFPSFCLSCYTSRHLEFDTSFTSEMFPQTVLKKWVLPPLRYQMTFLPTTYPTDCVSPVISLTCVLMETQWPLISISGSLKTFLNVRLSIFLFLLDSQSSETSSLEVAFSNGLLFVLCCAFFCPSLVVAHGAGLPGNI